MIRKKLQFILAISAVLLLFSGCIVTSLNPLYTEHDIPVFEEKLLGTWAQKGNDYWMFKQNDERPEDVPESQSTYWLYVFDGETSGKFSAVLFTIGEKRFLDILPEGEENGNYFYMLHMLPSHTFYHVELKSDELRLGLISLETFDDMVKENRANVDYVTYGEHDKYDEGYLLTAKSEKLQKFMLRCIEDGELTTEVYKRQNKE